jgi:hypothetical protein
MYRALRSGIHCYIRPDFEHLRRVWHLSVSVPATYIPNVSDTTIWPQHNNRSSFLVRKKLDYSVLTPLYKAWLSGHEPSFLATQRGVKDSENVM